MKTSHISKLSVAVFMPLLLLVGCGGGGGGSSSSRNAGPSDFTSPTLTGMSPAEDSFEIPTNSKLTATFSEAMVPTAINSANFRLSTENNQIAGTVSYDTTNHIAVFAPESALVPGIRYTATVITGIKDLGGNPLNNDFAWCFTVAATGDNTAPSVATTFPDNAAGDVATNRKISATFSKDMDSSTLTPANFRVTGPGATPVSGTVKYLGRTAVFTPTQVLALSTPYTATITAAVTDLIGNPLQAHAWTFTTGVSADVAAPVVNYTSPVGSSVAINSTINVTFNEPMDPTTITTANLLVAGPGSEPVVGTVAFDANTNTAIFTRINHSTTPVQGNPHPTPVNNFQPNTIYNVTLTTGVKDMAGNALATNKVWSFTTGGS